MPQPDPRWDRLKDLFAAAAAIPPNERESFLKERGCGDATVAEVLALLGAHEPVDEQPGDTIGPYKLLENLGEGGFGTVWMAEQRAPVQRRVALKVLKAGMDSAQVLARFEQERQALALMQHPNIAQVYDAGTTKHGRPFFVMELVKGIPITDYASRERLTIQQRLELFVQVCRAVQHAHHKGVVHRDIKPRNVLVATADGRPLAKVIDFGIAKAVTGRLTERTLFTEHRAMVGTLEYMSPEQAEGLLDVDTRADVYSLGALLYELLTGSTPFVAAKLLEAGFGEMLRTLREVEPERPSVRVSSKAGAGWAASGALGGKDPKELFGSLRGDLDWVVMKALEKDRARRYGTADGLAADLERYLAGEAVEAVPPSLGYRVRKFVRRNRGLVNSAALVALMLAFGLWAIAQKQWAEHNLQTSDEVVEELLKGLRGREDGPNRIQDLDEVLGDVADIYWRRGLKKRAIDLWREAGELDPGDSEWRTTLEAIELGVDPDNLDLTPFNTQFDPHSPLDEILGELADQCWSRGRKERAISLWREAQALDPEDEDWNDRLGAIVNGRAPFDPQLGLNENSNRPMDEMFGDVADTCWSRGLKDHAISLWREAQSADPEDSEWLNKLNAVEWGRDPLHAGRESDPSSEDKSPGARSEPNLPRPSIDR